MGYIDTIEVNGTEYEIVGPDGQYPISVMSDVDDDAMVSSGLGTDFRWMRSGVQGSYEYKLVVIPDSSPTDMSYGSYTDAS